MNGKANPQHLRLINKLKRVEKYKEDSMCITIETWSHKTGNKETEVILWSGNNGYIFKGSTMSELERFINQERKEAGVFQEKVKGGKK